MSKPAPSAALPMNRVMLRVLIVLNWLAAGAVAAMLVALLTGWWLMHAYHLSPSPDADRLIMACRAIAAVFLVAIPLHYVVLKRLLAIVETVRAGDPFVAGNALHLQAIAWMLLALQLLSLVVGAIARAVST